MVEPPVIELDQRFFLDSWRIEDAPAHRAFALDPLAARFLGWTVEEADAQADSYYVGVVRRFQREWRNGSRLSLAIRRREDLQAVGSVELRPKGDAADVSYFVAAELRGQDIAPRALDAFLGWAKGELSLQRASLNCRIDNHGSRRVAEKCGFSLVAREGDELRFARAL